MSFIWNYISESCKLKLEMWGKKQNKTKQTLVSLVWHAALGGQGIFLNERTPDWNRHSAVSQCSLIMFKSVFIL